MRYFPHTDEDITAMLQTIGADSLDDLFKAVPRDCLMRGELDLPAAMTEWDLNDHMDSLSDTIAASSQYKVFMGAGCYAHHIPASVSYLLGRSEFTTAYTPYQPEISQGTLQGIYEFQTLCTRLLGMDVATASHYDGATSLAEALLIAFRKTGRRKAAVSGLVHPLYRKVVKSYLRPTDYTIVEIPEAADGRTDLAAIGDTSEFAAVVVQSPNFFGCIEELSKFAEKAHENGALFIVTFTEPIAFGLIKNPGSQGADIVAGEGRSLGIQQSFGGPGLGILASTAAFMRKLPGRLVGRTTDVNGERGFVLTLSTREQHIRREKASSNICSNNGLCALTAAMYLASLGGTGLAELACLNHDLAEYLKKKLAEAGVRIPFSAPTFNEFVVDFGPKFEPVYKRLLKKKIIAGLPLKRFYPKKKGMYLVCATETMKKDDLDTLVREVTL
jgi:glycine dehydrogenase subunit 1